MQDQAVRAAGMIAAFCERIGLHALDVLVSRFQGRVLHGIKDDLIDLTNIKGVKGYTARMLYSAGLQTVEDVAKASVDEVHAALVKGKQPEEAKGDWQQARRLHNSAIKVWRVRFCAGMRRGRDVAVHGKSHAPPGHDVTCHRCKQDLLLDSVPE